MCPRATRASRLLLGATSWNSEQGFWMPSATKPPLLELGEFEEGKKTPKPGFQALHTTPYTHSANQALQPWASQH